ncbi:MAG TPA: CoA activase, partial [Firmicutes bacterium]|nr:CoA activase [Bacillota bacterium]
LAASRIRAAFDSAVKAQMDYHKETRRLGREILAELEKHPEKTAVVLFGRPYNAFFDPGNMGIPHKLASRGYTVIPYEFLPLEETEGYPGMYWAVGQNILQAARLVQKHPQLFGVYITNFSCGPDSFLVTYFRGIMGSKPSLTLELDSHSADAGIDTRVEAFLDIVRNYRKSVGMDPAPGTFVPARVEMNKGKVYVKSSAGDLPLSHDKVRLVIPAMGGVGAGLLAAVFRYLGVKAEALPPPGEKEFKLGQSFASGKECLPFILTLGSLMGCLEEKGRTEELLVYFMPETSGPCRFGQYNLLMKEFVKERKLKNVAFLSLNSANNYAGLGLKAGVRAWQAVVINDVLEEILSALLTLALNREEALKIFERVTRQITEGLEREPWPELKKTLARAAAELKAVKLAASLEETAKVALIGEIYVRQDGFSRKKLVERLANRGIMVKTAPVAEWLYYCDFLAREGITLPPALKNKLLGFVQGRVKIYFEREIKKILAASGLYEYHLQDVEELLEKAAAHISPRLTGEAILTIGAALTDIIERAAGVIAIGPFGCMPSRLAEAIINKRLNEPDSLDGVKNRILARANLPFLSLETDGNPFTPVIEAKLEAFCLQVKRMHGIIAEERQQEKLSKK